MALSHPVNVDVRCVANASPSAKFGTIRLKGSFQIADIALGFV